MNSVIWKAKLGKFELTEVQAPVGAQMLCAREQNEDVCVWFQCDPSKPKEPRIIGTAMTGMTYAWLGDAKYLGTASLLNAALILHVYEIAKL